MRHQKENQTSSATISRLGVVILHISEIWWTEDGQWYFC